MSAGGGSVRRGFGPWRLLLPVLLAAATLAGILETRRFDAGQQALEDLLRPVHDAAATLATARVRAAAGSAAGFEALEAARGVLPEVQALLEPDAESADALPDTRGLRDAFRRVGERADAVLDMAPAVLALADDAERLQSVATGLLVTSDELLELLIAEEAKPAQLRAAARQLMLVQRISTSLRRMLDADAGLLAAADRLGRDAVVFGEVATGLFNGSRDLGLERVESADAREVLAAIGRDFRILAQSVEAVMAGGAARATLGARDARLGAALQVLDGERARFAAEARARRGQRAVTPLQVAQLAGLTVVSLLAALVLALAEHRAVVRRWQTLRERDAVAARELEGSREELVGELERLASEIHRVADGDVGLRGHTGGYQVAPLGVARAGLDRIRQQLRERGEDGARLARNGQMVVEVAGRLRDVVSRHAEQAETAGHATRGMAAALESLRAESARVTDAARSSSASADAAGHALGETLHELEAVQSGIERCAERVRALEDVTRELRAVRTLVEDVGELGKMLSLNVAIQASMDGAASRALSAFSEEVQRLATRARSAVTQVESIHDELRGEAERAASAVKESVWRARSAAERGRGARSRVQELAGAARHLEALNHGLGRAQRDHALHVTDVVRAITALHALTREVREQVESTASSAQAFGELADGVERRLAAPQPDPVIDLPGRDDGASGTGHDGGAGDEEDGAQAASGHGRLRGLP